MSQNRRRHLNRDETIKLHTLMKDYVELGNKIDGVQYAGYKSPGMNDYRMAEIAQERLGCPMTYIQVRNMRTTMFGKVYRQPKPPKPVQIGPDRFVHRQQDGINNTLATRMGNYENTMTAVLRALDQLQRRLDELEQAHTKTRNGLWTKYNALLYHVKQLDTEWSSCRPPGYQPGLPEIVNDTDGDKS